MPPLRKKGRGGGGGKTEAPLPGEIARTSPSVSASVASKEREKRASSTTITTSSQGVEHLGIFVSRSFQKERGEKKLLETSRSSLSLTSGTFQKSLRSRRDASSTDSTPRLVTDASARREEREKRFSNHVGNRSSSASRAAREEPAVCRTSCRELGEEKVLYKKSVRAVGSERIVVGRKDEKSTEYSSRYSSIYPSISSVTVAGRGSRNSPSIDAVFIKSSTSQKLDRAGGDADLDSHLSKVSPHSPALLRKSPRLAISAISEALNASNIASTSPVVTLPVKSSCKCGAFRSSDNSPGLAGVVDGRRRGHSPQSNGDPTFVGAIDGRERKSRDLDSISQGTPHRLSTHSNSSAGKSNTPSFLQGRLALLEGRVSQIAAELKATKDLLDANNPACSKAVLSDLQLKISGIEKAINYRLARECGLIDQLDAEQFKGTYIQANDTTVGRHSVSSNVRRNTAGGKASKALTTTTSEIVPHGRGIYGKVMKTETKSRALTKNTARTRDRTSMTAAQQLSHVHSSRNRQPSSIQCSDQNLYTEDIGGSAPSSQVKPVFDKGEFEERLFPHQKLLRSRPSVHQKLMDNRAILHQKLVENSVLLRNKLAALEERDGLNCRGAFVEANAGEFITSLKQQELCAGSRLEKDLDGGKLVEDESGSSRPVFAGKVDVGDSIRPSASHYLEYDGEMVPNITRERKSSREGRRSSVSRKSISRTPPEPKDDLLFNPLDRVPSGSRPERRRRSSEKRKSISTSENCSPEPIKSASQIVMLEPAGKFLSSSHEVTILVPPAPEKSVEVDLQFAETFAGENLPLEEGYMKEHLMAEAQKNAVETKNFFPPTLLSEDAPVAICLGCEEILSSEDTTEDVLEYLLKTNADYDEQRYIGECGVDAPDERLHQIGNNVATAGWFISEGEGILLAHDDGCCSFYDIANREGKATFKGPPHFLSRPWGDCWYVRAAGSDGTVNKYVVAASIGGGVDSAFCSWDFYDRKMTAFHSESSLMSSPSSKSIKSAGGSSPEHRRCTLRNGQKSSCFSWHSGSENVKGRTPSGPLSLDLVSAGSGPSDSENFDIPLWWYRPCSPLLVSAASGLKTVTLYDFRDGDIVMRWDFFKWIACMEFSSPVQWRNKSKLVLAEDQAISLWDVNSMNPQRLHNIDLSGKELRALYVGNSDADLSVGIRQRASSQDSVNGDGVLCTQDSVNVLDFRVPAGIVLKMPTFGETANSVYANGDSVFAGVTDHNRATGSVQSKVNEWSIKQGRPMSMYRLPESSAHETQQSVTQIWGNSEFVLAINSTGLFMFDSVKGIVPIRGRAQSARDVLGTDDLVHPSFDFSENKVLLVSQDRPASWCNWP